MEHSKGRAELIKLGLFSVSYALHTSSGGKSQPGISFPLPPGMSFHSVALLSYLLDL